MGSGRRGWTRRRANAHLEFGCGGGGDVAWVEDETRGEGRNARWRGRVAWVGFEFGDRGPRGGEGR